MNRQPKILIIDDDRDLVKIIKITLESKQYEVIYSYTAEDGYNKVVEEKPDLIILDMLIDSRGEGFILSRKIKKNEEISKIPILMLTGMREKTGFFFPKDDPRDSKFLPVDEFVEKPVEPDVLLDRIEKLLNK